MLNFLKYALSSPNFDAAISEQLRWVWGDNPANFHKSFPNLNLLAKRILLVLSYQFGTIKLFFLHCLARPLMLTLMTYLSNYQHSRNEWKQRPLNIKQNPLNLDIRCIDAST